VAWVDERDGGPDGVRFEHIYFARGRQHGEWFTPSVRVDRGAPVRPATALDNKWAPTIAARGRRIVVAWSDFRNYNWDVYAAHSHTGAAFSTNVRVDDSPIFERINDHPALAIGDDGVVHAVWADRRDTAGDTNVFYARSIDGSRTFANQRQIDGSAVGFDPDRDTPSHQWHPCVATIGSDVVAVWQDNRLGDNDIFSVRSPDRGGSFALEERVDDSGGAPGEQTRPDVAVDGADQPGRSMYVIWEDDRTGTSAIRLVRRELR
jgi:large repetitive protein